MYFYANDVHTHYLTLLYMYQYMCTFTNNLVRYTCTQELEINFYLSNIDHYIYDYDLINRYIVQ